MSNCRNTDSHKRLLRGTLLGALGLCGLCCALPLLGGLVATSSVLAVAAGLEWIAAGLLLVAGSLGVWMAVRLKRAPRCEPGCGCRSEKG